MTRPWERAALEDSGIRPIPFDAGFDGCGGFFIRTRNATAGICYGCSRYGHRSATLIPPAARSTADGYDCINFRPLVNAEQVSAVDETAGLHGVNVPPRSDGGKPPRLGPLSEGWGEEQQHSGGVSK